jgi:hypothetical protein
VANAKPDTLTVARGFVKQKARWGAGLFSRLMLNPLFRGVSTDNLF